MTDKVYFTWPDRRFRYECRDCGACCKGHGIGSMSPAASSSSSSRSARSSPRSCAAAATRSPRSTRAIGAGSSRTSGLCRIEVEDGREAKPASCRLFPFNRVFRIGGYTVVDFNSVICPLYVGDDGIAHAEVLAEIESIKDPTIVGTQLPARDAEAEGKAFVEGERAIAEAMFAATAPVTSLRRGPRRPTRRRSRSSARPQRAAFTAIIEHAVASAERRRRCAAALWLTPSMRFNELYGPRQYAPRSAMPPVLARMWLAWLGFAALGEQLAASRARPPGADDAVVASKRR